MSDYEFLTTESLADYIRGCGPVAERIDADRLSDVAEVGDGNLNLVFLARDDAGRGMCLKQALPYVRMTGEGWPMTPERAAREAFCLTEHGALVDDLVPQVYDFHPDRYIIAMEDLSDHRVWRGLLNEGQRDDGVASELGRYVGAVAFGTSLFALERGELAQRVAATQNPELCEITEDLVFTEPAHDIGRNSVLDANREDAARFAADPAVVAGLGRAKWVFMTQTEALIHGDLHTGSVMVRTGADSRVDSVKAFDSEFAFYGPVAFDLGALFGNYVLATARAFALGDDEAAHWCLALVEQTWVGFEAEFRRRWPERRDPRVWGEGFLAERLAAWQQQAWLFAAAKMSRRIVGAAKVTDIETLEPQLREGAARGVLAVAADIFAAQVGDDAADWRPATQIARATETLARHRSA